MTKKHDPDYWRKEEPKVLEAKSVTIRLYQEAGKILFCYPDYTDASGQKRQGKTIAVHLSDLRTDESRAFFRELLEI